jgi:hypothetical protein
MNMNNYSENFLDINPGIITFERSTKIEGRAKNHPYRNKDMDAAIKVFQKWLDTYHKNKKN